MEAEVTSTVVQESGTLLLQFGVAAAVTIILVGMVGFFVLKLQQKQKQQSSDDTVGERRQGISEVTTVLRDICERLRDMHEGQRIYHAEEKLYREMLSNRMENLQSQHTEILRIVREA